MTVSTTITATHTLQPLLHQPPVETLLLQLQPHPQVSCAARLSYSLAAAPPLFTHHRTGTCHTTEVHLASLQMTVMKDTSPMEPFRLHCIIVVWLDSLQLVDLYSVSHHTLLQSTFKWISCIESAQGMARVSTNTGEGCAIASCICNQCHQQPQHMCTGVSTVHVNMPLVHGNDKTATGTRCYKAVT